MTMHDSTEVKAAVRKRYRAARDALDEQQRTSADQRIAHRVASLPAFRAAEVVFTYLSAGSEVDTRTLVRAAWAAGKTVAVPRCTGCGARRMDWHVICDFQGLERGAFGIMEPPADASTLVAPAAVSSHPAVALVPGLAFDEQGFRLGYGGGYYDAFLPVFPGTSIGLCRAAQLSAAPLPREPHDTPVNMIVTEGRVWGPFPR